MIIIEPLGGLANRMRVIASAMFLGKKSHQKIKLIWIPSTDEINCEFSDLFKPIEGVEVTNTISKYKFARSTNQQSKFKQQIFKVTNKIIGLDYCIKGKDLKDYHWNKKIDIISTSSQKKNIYIRTYNDLYLENTKEHLRSFKPKENIQSVVDEITDKFSRNTIGIHIRRTDNDKSIEFSPTSIFIEHMTKALKTNPNLNFFLATDDVKTEIKLKSLFKNKIMTYDKVLNRNLKEGIVDAVVDLYCLSKTKYIMGSYYSSFSEVASRIGKIKHKTLKKQ